MCWAVGIGKAWTWDSKTIRSNEMRQEKIEKKKNWNRNDGIAQRLPAKPNERIRHPKETCEQSTTTMTTTASVKACDEKRNKQKQKKQKRQTCPAIMAAINVIMAWNLHGNRFYVLHKLRNNKFLFVIIFHGRCVAMRFHAYEHIFVGFLLLVWLFAACGPGGCGHCCTPHACHLVFSNVGNILNKRKTIK